MKNRRSIFKTIVFSLLPLIIFGLVLELSIRTYYYYREGPNSFAVVQMYNAIKWRVTKKLAERQVSSEFSSLGGQNIGKLFHRDRLKETALGMQLNHHYYEKYEEYFLRLVEEVNNSGAIFAILHPNSSSIEGKYSEGPFFKFLAEKYDVPLLGLRSVFLEYDYEVVTLTPENSHLSRFGNRLIAKELLKLLDNYKDHRAGVKQKNRPNQLGDLTPNSNRMWLINPKLPYRLVTNSQGLRAEHDLEFPALKQRVLFLGDSLTFGPYLENHDTYPGLIQYLDPSREYVNAGISGYSIAEQLDLFVEKARYVDPDIVVLQVCNNDILSGMTTNKMNYVRRSKKVHEYSDLEIQYIRERSISKLN